MIVTCTNCGIHYNLDERLVNPDGSKVRCDACETVFTVGKDGAWPVRDEMADSALPAVSDEEDTGDGSPGFWMSAAGEVLVAPPGLRLLDEPTELSMGLGPEPLPLGRQMGLGEDLGVEPGSLWREPEESIGDDREAVEIDQALRGLGKDLQDGEESGQEPGDELEYTEVEGPEPVEKALEHLGENLETLGTGRVAMEVSDSSRYPETYGDDSGEETEIDAGGEPVDDALRELAHDLGSHDAEPAGGDGLAEEEPRTGLEGDSSQASDSEGWGGAVEEESPETGGPEVDEALEHLGEDLESLGRQETGPYEYATGGPSWPDSGETDEETKAADHVYADAESVGRINAELDDPEMFEDLGQDVNMEGKPAARVLEEEYASEPRNMDVATEGLDEGALDVEADLDLGAGPPGYSPREDSEGTSDDLEDVSLDLEEWDESEEPARRGEPGPQEGPGGVNAVGDALETAEEEEFPEEELEEEGPGPMDDLGMPDLGATAEEIESLAASEYGETEHEGMEADVLAALRKVEGDGEVEDISDDLEDVEDISDDLEDVEEEFPEEEPVEFLEETVEVVEEFEETEAGDEAGPFAGPVDEAAEDLFTGDEDFGAVDEFEEVEDISEDLEDVEDISDALEAVEEEFPEEEPVEFLEETVEVVEEFEETEAGDEADRFADAVDEAAEDLFAGDEDFAEVDEFEEEGPGPMDDLGMPDLGATAEEIESLDVSGHGETGHEQTEAGTVDEFEEVEDISEDLEDVEDISDALEAVEEEFPEEEPVEFLEETVEVAEEFEETEAGDEADRFAGVVDEAAEDLFAGDEDFAEVDEFEEEGPGPMDDLGMPDLGATAEEIESLDASEYGETGHEQTEAGPVDEFEEVEDISEDLEDVEDISDALEAVEEEFPEEEPVEFLEETVEVVEEFEETEAGDEAGPFADAVDEAAEDLFAGDEDFGAVDEFEEEGPGPMDDLGMPDLGATAEEIESLDVSEILEDVEDISGDMEAVEEEFSEEEPIEFLEEVEETEADDEADRFARDELPDYEALEPEEPPEDLEEITEGVEELVDFADLTEKPESPGFADDEGVEAGFGQEDFPDDIGLALEEGTIEEPPDLPEYPLSDDEGLEEALLSGAFEVEGAPSPEGPEAEEVEEEFEGLDVDLAALEEDGTTDQEEKEEAEESPSEQIVGEEAALEEAEFDLGLPLLDEEAEEEPAVEVGEETADEAFDLGLPDLDDGLLEEEAEEEEEATGLGFLTDAEGLDEDMDLGLPDAEGDLMAPEPEASEAFADLGIDLTLPDVDEEEEEGLPFEPAEVDAEAEEEETDPFDLGLPELGEPPPDDEEVVSPPSAPAAAPFASPIQAGGDDLGGDFDLGLNLLDEEEIAVALKESEAREEEEEEFDLGLPDLSTESGEEATSGSPDSRVTPPSVTGTEPARDQDIPLPEASVPETASATEPVTVSGEFEDFDTSLPGEEEDEPAGGIEEDDFEIPDPESLVLEDDLDDEEDTGHGPMDQSIMDSVVDFDLGDEEEDGEEYGPSGKDSVVESTSVLSDDIPTDFDLPDGEGEQLEGKVMTDTPEKDTDATLNGPDIEDLDLDMDLSDDEPRGGEVSEDSGDAASDLDLDLDVDLDLDLDSEESAPAEEEAAREPQTSADLDLDLDLGDTEASAEPSGGAEEDMDFDLGDIEADAEPDAEDTDMDFDLGDLDSSDETTVSDEGDFDLGGPGGADETPSAAESDDMDLDFDLEAPSPPSSGGGEMDLDLGEGPEAGESDDLMSAATGGTDGDMGGSPGNILDLDLDELEAETEQYASKEENEDLLDDDLGLPDLNAPTEEDTGGMDLEFEDELAELDESKSEPEAELDLESPGEDMEEDILSEEVEPTDTLELEMDNGVETASPEDETVAVDTGELDLDTGGLDSDDLDMDMEGMGDSPEELAEEGGLDMDFEATMEMEEPVLQEEPPEETRLEDPMRRREEEEPREVEQEIASEEVEMEEEEEETAEEKTPAKGKKEKKAKKAEAGDKVRLGGGTSPLKVVLLLLLLVVAAGLGVFFYMPGILPSFLTGGGQAEEAGVVDPGNMKIELVRVQESFATDRTGSLVFVINGTIRNDYETARKQIRVRGRLFDAQGNPVGTSTAYVGNKLTEQDISNMNPEAIRQQMNSRNGVNNVNDNVAPGQLVPFSLVFFNLPENLAEYAVEVTTSMPAG